MNCLHYSNVLWQLYFECEVDKLKECTSLTFFGMRAPCCNCLSNWYHSKNDYENPWLYTDKERSCSAYDLILCMLFSTVNSIERYCFFALSYLTASTSVIIVSVLITIVGLLMVAVAIGIVLAVKYERAKASKKQYRSMLLTVLNSMHNIKSYALHDRSLSVYSQGFS